MKPESTFGLRAADGAALPVQSRVLATWPDGSVKWSGHAALATPGSTPSAVVAGGESPSPAVPITVRESEDAIVVDTGALLATIPTSGPVLVSSLAVPSPDPGTSHKAVATDGRVISQVATDPDGHDRADFHGVTDSAAVEHLGPVQATILITGHHLGEDGRSLLPFRIRLQLSADSDHIRIIHSFVWDGDPQADFLAALGLRFDVPLNAPLPDRHVRIAGTDGFLAEAAQPVTGLFRDPGAEVRQAQVDGRATPATDRWKPARTRQPWRDASWGHRMLHVPVWNDWTLTQPNADGYSMRKRTGEGYGWVSIPSGRRSRGYAYLGQPDGGLAMGLRNFWQSHPTGIDIRGAGTSTGSITLWMWSPEVPPMDVRFYHEGANEDDPICQVETVEITYEDYQARLGSAHGIGRTHEIFLHAAAATPDTQTLLQHAQGAQTPPQLVPTPEALHAARVFADWAPRAVSPGTAAPIEERLDRLVAFYAD